MGRSVAVVATLDLIPNAVHPALGPRPESPDWPFSRLQMLLGLPRYGTFAVDLSIVGGSICP